MLFHNVKCQNKGEIDLETSEHSELKQIVDRNSSSTIIINLRVRQRMKSIR